MKPCTIHELDLVTYENGVRMQEWLVAKRQREEIPDQLLLLEHAPVITLGRGGDITNLVATKQHLEELGIEFFETTRGGDITYHGPGQIVGYPIFHLGEGRRDIRKFVEMLEEALVRTAREFGIEARGDAKDRGVWVGDEKLAAIGVRIARWVTSHGFAFNVDPDLSHFETIVPCGIRGKGVTSLSRLGGRRITAEEVLPHLRKHLAEVFDRELIPAPPPLKIVKCVIVRGREVLLLKRVPAAGGFWQPVTGRVEDGESAIDAARRETLEETSLHVEPVPLDLVQSFLISEGPLEGTMIHEEAFVAAAAEGAVARANDREEHDEIGWFPLGRALEMVRWSDDRKALHVAARRNRRTS
jgi:lipoyl(octanoyl) transferase